MISNFRRRTVSSASSPRPIRVTLYPSIWSTLAQLSRSVRSSSTTSTRILALTSLGMERGSREVLSETEGIFRSCWARGLAILRTPGEDRWGGRLDSDANQYNEPPHWDLLADAGATGGPGSIIVVTFLPHSDA